MPVAQHLSDRLLQRIKGEYLEMPGLSLTLSQAARLWALDHQTCENVLRGLVQTGFLVTTTGGTFVQASTQIPRYHPAPVSAA